MENFRIQRSNTGQLLVLDSDDRIVGDLTANAPQMVANSGNTPQVITGVKQGTIARPLVNDGSVSTQVVRYNFAKNVTGGTTKKIVFGDITGFVSATLSPSTTYADGFSGNQVPSGSTDLGLIGGAGVQKVGFNSMLRAVGALEIVSLKAYTNSSDAFTGTATIYEPPAGGLQLGANQVYQLSAQIPVNQNQYQGGVVEFLAGAIVFRPDMALVIEIPDETALILAFEVRRTEAITF